MLKTVLTDTLEIAYEEVGDPAGGPVILLHGFPDDAKAWAAAARGLSDAGEYNETAASFDNPDFVEIVIHSYRHRYGAAPGDPALEPIERQLVGQPVIKVPAIVLHGEGDGVHPPERSEGQEKLFPRYYERWLIPEAGHLFPREAPDAVIAAVQKLARLQ